jgi:hypothetical protein
MNEGRLRAALIISGHTRSMHVLVVALVLVHGLVMRGPTKPVCEMTTPCSEPAAHVLLVFQRAGAAAIRIRTDANGRYSVRVRPGRYVVGLTQPVGIGRGIQPAAIVVRTSRRADFFVDTGIR